VSVRLKAISAAVQPASAGSDFSTEIRSMVFTYVCFGLLLLSCCPADSLSTAAKCLWLLCTLILSFVSPASALGTYIAAVAIYGARHFQGWGSPFERPDNFALPLVLGGLAWAGVSRPHPRKFLRLLAASGALVGYGLLQMAATGTASRAQFAWFMQMFGIPMILLAALLWAQLPLNEVRGFTRAIGLLAAYLGVTCLLEAWGHYDWLIPAWIADPTLNVTIGTGRVGGPLLQSEWNGLALGLIYCVLLGTAGLTATPTQRATKYLLGALCAASVYFTYTRAAWIGVAAASVAFIYRKRDSKRTVLALLALIVVLGIAVFSGRQASARLEDSETAYFRVNIWAEGLHLAAEKPFFGHGFGTFGNLIAGYQGGLNSLPETKVSSEGTVAHNTLISIVVEEGLLGLALYCMVVVLIVGQAAKQTREMWPAASTLVLAISLTYFLNVMFVVAYEPTTNFLYYSVIGLVAGLPTVPLASRVTKLYREADPLCVESPA